MVALNTNIDNYIECNGLKTSIKRDCDTGFFTIVPMYAVFKKSASNVKTCIG